MYNIVSDLLRFYYVSISVALLIGGIGGFGIAYAWLKGSRQVDEMLDTTQGAAYDACEEPVTDYDAEAVRKLLSW